MEDSIDSGSGQLATKMQGLALTLGRRATGATAARSLDKIQNNDDDDDRMFFQMAATRQEEEPKTQEYVYQTVET